MASDEHDWPGAVAAAYGWPADLADAELLERLLALNLERARERDDCEEFYVSGRVSWGVTAR